MRFVIIYFLIGTIYMALTMFTILTVVKGLKDTLKWDVFIYCTLMKIFLWPIDIFCVLYSIVKLVTGKTSRDDLMDTYNDITDN